MNPAEISQKRSAFEIGEAPTVIEPEKSAGNLAQETVNVC